MTHRVRVEAKDIGVDQRPIIPIVPRRCLVDRPASRAAAEAISGTVEACFELMLASARQSSDGRREAVIWITSARNGEPHDLRKLPSPTRRFRIDYCAYSLSPAGSPVAAAILCVAGVRHLARLSDPAGFSGILAKIAGWRAAFRSGGALGVGAPLTRHPRGLPLGTSAAATRLSLLVSGKDGSGRAIRTEIIHALDGQQLAEPAACAVDAALDCAHGATADLGGLLVGKSGRAHENEGLALIGRQFGEGGAELHEFHPSGLLGLRLQSFGVTAVGVFDFAPALAIFGAKQVAQYREQPCGHVGPALERVDIGEGAQQGFLHEIVGTVDIPAERNGERTQVRNRRQDGLAHRWIEIHELVLLAFMTSCRPVLRDGPGDRQSGPERPGAPRRRTWPGAVGRFWSECPARGWVRPRPPRLASALQALPISDSSFQSSPPALNTMILRSFRGVPIRQPRTRTVSIGSTLPELFSNARVGPAARTVSGGFRVHVSSSRAAPALPPPLRPGADR